VAEINAALAGLNYHPDANFHGTDQLSITINDLGNTGTGGPLSDVDTVDITINSVNDAPSGADNAKTIPEDGSYTFGTADFGFTDPNDTPPDAFQAVLTQLPTAGTLTLDNVTLLV